MEVPKNLILGERTNQLSSVLLCLALTTACLRPEDQSPLVSVEGSKIICVQKKSPRTQGRTLSQTLNLFSPKDERTQSLKAEGPEAVSITNQAENGDLIQLNFSLFDDSPRFTNRNQRLNVLNAKLRELMNQRNLKLDNKSVRMHIIERASAECMG